MIKNIFLPEKVNNYYLFSQRIVGITIGSTHINATQLYIKGRSFTVEKCIQETIEIDNTTTSADRTIVALKKIKTQLNSYDELHTVLSSSVIVFKELKLPFYDYEKIKMIINFEVEPLLPFAIKDSVIDFIITKHIKEEQSAEILVAATQKKHIAEHLHLFEQAGMTPTAVTVDLFALYGLYQDIPSYFQQQGSVALLGLDMHSTHIGHIYNSQLRTVRTLPKGLSSIVKTASDSLHLAPREIMNQFIRFGLAQTDNPLITDALKAATKLFLSDISFTLNSFAAQTGQGEPVNTVLLFGDGATVQEFPLFVHHTLSIPTAPFDIHELILTKKIILKSMSRLPNAHLVSLGAIIPNKTTDNFNLLKDEFSPSTTTLFIKQIAAACLLSIVSLVTLISYSLIETKKMETEELDNKQEIIELLHKQFPKEVGKEETNLDEALENAKKALQDKEKTWQPHSSESRLSVLTYLLELTNIIDKDALKFNVETIKIAPNIMNIKATVHDWEALKILEKELKQSKLFKYEESQTSPSFEMNITLVHAGDKTT